jgi:hypothetical protein
MPQCIGHYDKPFDLVVQRYPIRQSVLDLEEHSDSQTHCAEGYVSCANALHFRIAALSYNLFSSMRQLLPEDLASHRVTTIRWRLYGMAAK